MEVIMKKSAFILCLIFALALAALISCKNDPWKNQVIEEAVIERVFPNFLQIRCTYDSGKIYYYNINICNDIRWKNKNISLADLHVGDKIRVTYDGATIELYPALIEGTTKIELLENTISPPTTEFRAQVQFIDTNTVTVIGKSTKGYEGKQFTFALSDDIRYVKDYRVIEKTDLCVGDIIFVTHQGNDTDEFNVIRVEIYESQGGIP